MAPSGSVAVNVATASFAVLGVLDGSVLGLEEAAGQQEQQARGQGCQITARKGSVRRELARIDAPPPGERCPEDFGPKPRRPGDACCPNSAVKTSGESEDGG